MFAALGIRWTTEDLARHYHPDWYRVYRAARIHRSHWTKADRLWRAAYDRETPRLLTGTRAVLRGLARRFTLGLVTSGDGTRVRAQLQKLGLAGSFKACVCAEDAAHRKPHPAPLLRALRLLGLSPNECVYVGDSPQDMEMALRAGVRAIGVFGPFPTEHGLRAARPDLLLHSVKELPRYIAEMPHAADEEPNAWRALPVKRKTKKKRAAAKERKSRKTKPKADSAKTPPAWSRRAQRNRSGV